MRDVQVFGLLLGLQAPWRVARVVVSGQTEVVDVFVEHAPGARFACPTCGRECAVYDHTRERAWRHLDTMQFQTIVHASPPRVRCPEHGTKQVSVPWAEDRVRFTALWERRAIDVCDSCSTAEAAKLMHASWDEMAGVQNRAVERGLARRGDVLPAQVGVDEKRPGKGQRFFTVVSDLSSKCVVWVGDGRNAESLNGYWDRFTATQREQVKCIGMDMSAAYASSTRSRIPEADTKIVYDRFHVMQLANKAVDQVRRDENTALMREGNETLKGTRYVFLYAEENVPEKYAARLAELRRSDLRTARAWGLKEHLRRLWDCNTREEGKRFLTNIRRALRRTNLAPLRKLGATLGEHARNILTYLQHRITNAAAEGLNAAIQRLKTTARGYRNREHFKTAIYFHLAGLDLYPALATAPPAHTDAG